MDTPTNWDDVPWTEFAVAGVRRPATASHAAAVDAMEKIDPPQLVLMNSRYMVTIFGAKTFEPFGEVLHLSIKTHDKQPRHDWRDLQRIKNEICGPEFDAVEIYPAEDKLVDSANQTHLFVFGDYKIPFGFQSRLVCDESWNNTKQRPFPPGERPADCMNAAEFQALTDRMIDSMRTP